MSNRLTIAFCVAVGALSPFTSARAGDDPAALVKQLETFDREFKARQKLVELGAPAVDALVAALKHRKTTVVEQAAFALGKIGDVKAVPALLACVTTGADEGPVGACSDALKAINDPSIVPQLRPVVRQGKARTFNVYESISLLGHFKDAESKSDVLKFIKSPNAYTRHAVVLALANLGDPAVAKDLRPMIADKDAVVASAALESLGKLGDQDSKAAMLERFEAKSPLVESAAVALGLLGELEPLSKALAGENWKLREAAMSGLAASRDPKAVDAVIGLLDDPRMSQTMVVQALARSGDPRAIAPLEQARAALLGKGKTAASFEVQEIDKALARLGKSRGP